MWFWGAIPSLPHPTGRGSSRDIPGKAGQGCRPRSCPSPALSHAPYRGDITRGGVGEGTPSPAKRTIPALLQGSRAGAGVLVARVRAGRKPGVGTPIVRFTGISSYTALLSPPPHPRLRRSSPAPQEGGSSRDIPGKGTSTGKAGPARGGAVMGIPGS